MRSGIMAVRIYTVNGRKYEVEILGGSEHSTTVRVNGNLYAVSVQGAGPARATAMGPAPGMHRKKSPYAPRPKTDDPPRVRLEKGDKEIRAPMPGTVIAVRVREGQRISVGDELLVLESMKMENVIQSPADGEVGSVLVAEGQQVGSGDTLLIIGE